MFSAVPRSPAVWCFSASSIACWIVICVIGLSLQRQLDRLTGLGGSISGEDHLVRLQRIVQIGKDRLAIENSRDERFDLPIERMMRDISAIRQDRRRRAPPGLPREKLLAPQPVVADGSL